MKENFQINIVFKGFIFVFSVFLLALCYNLFLLPNNLVIGGVSGLSIIVHNFFKISPTTFIYVANILLLILSFIFLGKEKTKNTILGSLMYPLMITFSAPIADVLLPYLKFEDFWITALLAALLFGYSEGLIFKHGYTTGGADILVQMFSKYLKFPEGKAMLIINLIIIIGGGLTFGLVKAVYAILVLYLSSNILDKVMFEKSNSKVFYVYTKKINEVKKVILEEFKTGFTLMPTKGGYSHEDGQLIMCVLSNRYYYHFKERILNIDDKAFFVINDCYESQGGFKKKKNPYI